jgi:hypothetical protein
MFDGGFGAPARQPADLHANVLALRKLRCYVHKMTS